MRGRYDDLEPKILSKVKVETRTAQDIIEDIGNRLDEIGASNGCNDTPSGNDPRQISI